MKNNFLLVIVAILSSCSGNKDASNQAGVPAVTPQVVVQGSGQYNPAQCPLNLVGTYELQNGRINRGHDAIEMMHVSTQQDGILVATQQTRGASNYTSLMIADGVRRGVENSNVNDYQISYCENQTIVTVGSIRGSDFKQVLYGTSQGVELSYTSSRDRPQVLSYRRTRM
ncbi:MAG: hypothetical protein H7256_16740 [Bdellovibrio sp.]|nr:hypothetical protein [Bdellovibrio sp.]